MRRYVGRIQLCRDGQVLDRFFKIATFLNEFIPESVTTEKTFGFLVTICLNASRSTSSSS